MERQLFNGLSRFRFTYIEDDDILFYGGWQDLVYTFSLRQSFVYRETKQCLHFV